MKAWLALLLASLLVAWADSFLVVGPDALKLGTNGPNTNALPLPRSSPLPQVSAPFQPVKLPPRVVHTGPLNPSPAEVRQMMKRILLGPDKEPEWSRLLDRLTELDFRDYPEEFAQVVGNTDWLNDLDGRMKNRFRGNDDPRFVEAVLAHYEATKAEKTGYFSGEVIKLLSFMTSSPALIPPLQRALDTTPDSPVYSACLIALEGMQSPEAARAVYERAKLADDNKPPGFVYSKRELLLSTVDGFRNPEIVPYLEQQLAHTKDEALALALRSAIMATKQGWPRTLTPEQWKLVKGQ